MKTIEKKARAYDAAHERANIIYTSKYKPEIAAWAKKSLEAIFPELAELEDERIRKELISFVNNDGWRFTKLTKEEKESWVTWLEKQGEQNQSAIMWHDVSEKPNEMKELLVEWAFDDATWHTVGFYDARTDMFRGEYKMPIDNVVRWMYIDELLEKE